MDVNSMCSRLLLLTALLFCSVFSCASRPSNVSTVTEIISPPLQATDDRRIPIAFVDVITQRSILTPLVNGIKKESKIDRRRPSFVTEIEASGRHPFTVFGNGVSKVKSVWFSTDQTCSFEKKSQAVGFSAKVTGRPADNVLQIEIGPLQGSDAGLHLHLCTDPHVSGFTLDHAQAKITKVEGVLFLPLYIEIFFICLCLSLSCIFSGLTTGLMALSTDDLMLISKGSKDEKERQYADNILPLRENGNLLLCTLILGNTLVNCVATILINNISSVFNVTSTIQAIIALAFSTATITLLGEILPQAICSKYGLRIGSQTRYLTIFFIVLLWPVAHPAAWVLDRVVGVEGRDVYDRKMLKELIKMRLAEPKKGKKPKSKSTDAKTPTDLALATIGLPERTARDVMSDIRGIFMLSDESILDKELLRSIANKGRTRIPIFRGKDRNNIIGVLNIKDILPFMDTDLLNARTMKSFSSLGMMDAVKNPKYYLKIGTVASLWSRSAQFRFALSDTPVVQLMNEMKMRGAHVVFITDFDDHRRSYVVIGMATFEDVVEEVVGEIMDEKDVNRLRRRGTRQAFR